MRDAVSAKEQRDVPTATCARGHFVKRRRRVVRGKPPSRCHGNRGDPDCQDMRLCGK